jgi:hypothetical protein
MDAGIAISKLITAAPVNRTSVQRAHDSPAFIATTQSPMAATMSTLATTRHPEIVRSR